MLHTLLPPGTWQKIKIAGLVRNLKVHRRWQPLTLHRQRANRRLDRARRAEGVPVVALGTAHRSSVGAIAQHLLDGHRLGGVVERRRAAVGVDVPDLVGRNVRVLQREPHRSRGL